MNLHEILYVVSLIVCFVVLVWHKYYLVKQVTVGNIVIAVLLSFVPMVNSIIALFLILLHSIAGVLSQTWIYKVWTHKVF
jgi:hypothetical protein